MTYILSPPLNNRSGPRPGVNVFEGPLANGIVAFLSIAPVNDPPPLGDRPRDQKNQGAVI